MTYTKKTLKQINLPDGSTVKQLQVYRTDKKPLTQNELQKLVMGITNKYNYDRSCSIRGHADALKCDNEHNIMIRGLRPDRWSTLKAWDDDFETMEHDDYLNGRATTTSKFDKYFQLEINLIVPK